MAEAAEKSLDDITLADRFELEDLVDRKALAEMIQSVEDLFGIPIRLYSASGKLLTDASRTPELYEYLEQSRAARAALQDVIVGVRRAVPHDGPICQQCITGAQYRVSAILYEGKAIGRFILGPYLPPTLREVPKALFEADPGLDRKRVKALTQAMPIAHGTTVEKIERHLQATLDLLLFSGLRALLASNMHLAAVRENFRELQESNIKLKSAYERLKELDRLKSNFLATVSHELRTPLTSIIGYSEMLREGIPGELNEEQLEFVSTIHDKGNQLLELVKSLLDLSKLESGTMRLRKATLDAEPLVKDVVATLTPTARKKGVSLAAEIEADLPELWADGERLRQVLLNLSENAIKFTPTVGCVTVGAKLGWAEPEGSAVAGGVLMIPARRKVVELYVRDTGIGITEDQRERVFDAFYQVDSSSTREQGGTGLGLSIVKRLVDGHDGSIRIENNEPTGTVFVVTLPVRGEAT